MTSPLAGQVAIVTGGATGIGRAIAIDLALLGASVVVVARNSMAEARAVVGQIETAGGKAISVKADVTSETECSHAIEAALRCFDRLDILVNNAGLTRDSLLVRMSVADWDLVSNTNLRGIFFMTRAAVKPMLERGHGKIVNITSVIGLIGNSGQANYASAKAAVGGFTKALAVELAGNNIQVNAVAPGFIETRLTRDLAPGHRARLLAQTPAGRFGTPRDVSGLAAFLCTDRADFITGQTIVVDGGMTA